MSAITCADMMPLLAEADPALAPIWRAWEVDWSSETEPPLYGLLTALARHLVAQLQAGDTGRFGAVFDVIERWHVDGDATVREAATVGLLEDLQNRNLYASARPEQFEPWLRPVSRRCWDQLNRFWSTGQPITDEQT